MPDEPQPSAPGGPASPDPGVSARRVLERLGEAECMELLADGGMGRLVFNSRYGLTALPVVLVIDRESVVLGTWDPVFDEDLRTGIEHADYQVAVEADQIKLDAREGWVVLVRGRHIIWIPRLSVRRSSMPGSCRGLKGYLRTLSGWSPPLSTAYAPAGNDGPPSGLR